MEPINKEENSRQSSWPLWTAIIVGLIFFGWIWGVASSAGWVGSFDRTVSRIAGHSPGAVATARFASKIGETKIMLILSIIIAIVFWLVKQRMAALFMVTAEILTLACNLLLKDTIRRARPAVQHLAAANGYSFPSGHSSSSMALFLALALLCTLLIKRRPWRIALFVILLIVPLIIGWSRITVRVHFPSDVFGGFLEGIFFTLAAYAFFRDRIRPQQKIQSKFNLREN